MLFLYTYTADDQYKSYYPQYHQPLKMMLGKPLHLEVRLLNSPDPTVVLLVHFCVAYPRSGKAVWVLLYNGYVEKCEKNTKGDKKIQNCAQWRRRRGL